MLGARVGAERDDVHRTFLLAQERAALLRDRLLQLIAFDQIKGHIDR